MGNPSQPGNFRGGQFCAKMSDGEVETPVEAPAPAVGEPLDLMSALQMVLKKSMACHSLLRGLHEVARTTERRPRDSPSSWSTSRALRAHGPAAALETLRTFDMGVGGPRPSTLFPAKPEPKKLKKRCNGARVPRAFVST